MEKSSNVDVVTPKHYGVISQHYGVISWYHDRNCFPLLLRFMDLRSPWRKGVLCCSGSWDHFFVSQAYRWWAIVPKPSQTLFFGIDISGCPASKLRATSEKNAIWDSGTFFVRNTYLGIPMIIVILILWHSKKNQSAKIPVVLSREWWNSSKDTSTHNPIPPKHQ